MDTDTLWPERADVIAVKQTHRSAKLPTAASPVVRNAPARALQPSASGHTTPQSEPSSTDGDDTLLYRMPTSVATPAVAPSKPKSSRPAPATQPKKVKSTAAAVKPHAISDKRATPIKTPPVAVPTVTPPPPAGTNTIDAAAAIVTATAAANDNPDAPASASVPLPAAHPKVKVITEIRHSTCRIPPHLVPSWLPSSAFDWTDDDDSDDVDIYRYIYLRRKTDAEMEAFARSRPPPMSSSKHKSAHNNHHSGPNSVPMSTAPPAATTRSRKQADAAARRGADPNTQASARDRGASQHTHQSLPPRQPPAVSTRKRSRAAAQLDSGRNHEEGSRRLSPTSHGRNAHNGANGHTSGKYGHRSDGDARQAGTSIAGSTPSHKKVRHGHGSSSGRTPASRDQFVKHESKKGWLVCKKCRTAVWPPNIGKHDSTCPGQ